jgi:hypothetical protein
MRSHPIDGIDVGFSMPDVLVSKMPAMDREGLEITERIEEILMMCAREHPVYEQITSFSIALYALGFFDCPDLMGVQDVDSHEAALVLNEHFKEIKAEALPSVYHIAESKEKYLLVVGDPQYPIHFAVLVDAGSSRPFFSKLPFFGSGFDSLDELINEFVGIDGMTREDLHFFKKNGYGEIPPESRGKIYIVKNDQ